MSTNYRPETICIQAGWKPKKGEPRVLPIYQSTTFKYDNSDQMGRLFDLEESGYFYTRLQNPTNDAVAAKITELEGGVAGMLTSSGQLQTTMQYLISVKQEIISSVRIPFMVELLICLERQWQSRGFPVHLLIRMPLMRNLKLHFYQIPRQFLQKRSRILP